MSIISAESDPETCVLRFLDSVSNASEYVKENLILLQILHHALCAKLNHTRPFRDSLLSLFGIISVLFTLPLC